MRVRITGVVVPEGVQCDVAMLRERVGRVTQRVASPPPFLFSPDNACAAPRLEGSEGGSADTIPSDINC